MVLKAPLNSLSIKNIRDPRMIEAICLCLKKTGKVKVKVWGKSMFPVIWPGAQLWFSACEISELRIGDIALFKSGNGLIAHRVVYIGDRYIELQGDAYPLKSQKVNAEFVLAKAEGFVLGKWSFPISPHFTQELNKSIVITLPVIRKSLPPLRKLCGRITRTTLFL